MGEISLGDITARLRLDTSALQQGMRQAEQALVQFQQQMQQQAGGSQQVSDATRRAMQETAQAARQAAQESSQAFRREAQERALAGQQAAQAARQAFQASAQAARQAAQQSAQAARTAYQQTAIAAQQAAQQASQAFQQQMQATAQAAQAARQATQTASSGLANMLQIAGGIGIATSLAGIITALKNVAVETVQVGARFEQLRASLSAIGGSTTAGQQQFQFLVGTAQQLGVAFQPLAEGWRRLTAAASLTNLTVAEQQRLLTAVANEARRVGTSNEELQRLMTGLGQVFSKGTLSMEEMRGQIGEALPTAFGALARGMGRTTEELTKLISTGSVGATEFARAFTRGLEQVQRASGQMAEGATQAFNRLATAWKQFQDALANSGVNTYFAQVADNLREAVEWATKLLKLVPKGEAPTGPPPEFVGPPLPPRPQQGPTPSGAPIPYGTPEELQQIKRLEDLIRRYEALQAKGSQAVGLDKLLEGARAELAARREALAATERQAIAQGRVAEETAKTHTEAEKVAQQKERQASFEESLRKKLAEVRKAEETFQRESALAPGVLGRPQGGTPDETQEYLRNRQQAIKKDLQDLITLAAAPPQGATVPEAIRREINALAAEYLKLGEAIKTSQDAEQKRQQAAREAQQQAERAIGQEIQLRAQLEQVKGVLARPTESPAERARTQELQRFVDAQRTVDQALKQFADNPALRARAPEMQKAFEDLKTALDLSKEAAGLKAFNDAMVQQVITPLEQLAGTYEFTKQKRDTDTASQLAAMAVGTQYEEQARQLAETVRQIGEAQSQARLDRLGQSVQDVVDKLNLAGRSPLEQELGTIRQQFVEMDTILVETARKLDQLWESASPDERLQIAERLNQISAAWAGLGAARDKALQTKREEAGEAVLTRLREELERMQAPRGGEAFPWEESREQIKLRQQAARTEMTPEQRVQVDALLAQHQAQRELNYGLELFAQLSEGVGSAWVNALQSIAEGTKTVSEAFREMGRSILQTMAQIASQEATKAFIQLGFRVLTGALTSGPTPVAAGGGTLGTSSSFVGQILGSSPQATSLFGGVNSYQHGGVVRRPTLALLGENPANNPETILNRQQMAAMMQGGGRGSGGEGGGISIINVGSRAQAEQTAQEQRAMGRTAVINYVNENLSLGESSSILRNLRSLQR